MAIESFISLRRFVGLIVVLAMLCLCAGAVAQTAQPLVTASHPGSVPNDIPTAWQGVWNVAVSSEGDLIVMSFQTGGIYQIPADGRSAITVGSVGGWANPGIALDKWNNMYVGDDWNGDLNRVPYNPSTKTWNWSAKTNWTGGIGWFHATAMSGNANGVLAIGFECCGKGISTVTLDAAGNPSPETVVLATVTARPRSMAMDNAGNIYYTKDGTNGVFYVPAGSVNLADESTVTRIDPNLNNILGVGVDAVGNVYISDSSVGVYVVPIESGVPNKNHAYLLTPVSATAPVGVDNATGTIYVPTSTSGTGWNGILDVAKVSVNTLDIGSSPVGVEQTDTKKIYLAFNGNLAFDSVSLPADFIVASDPESCSSGTTYHAGESCSLKLSLKPSSVGNISGLLSILGPEPTGGGTKPVLAQTPYMHGIGVAAVVAALPPLESTLGASLNAAQISTDQSGNVFVLDATLKQVLQYPYGATSTTAPVSVTIPGAAAPTGMAVDSLGNIYVADSGNIIKIPSVQGVLNPTLSTTMSAGLGSTVKLAAKDVNVVYAADPSNHRVVKIGNSAAAKNAVIPIGSGFDVPSALALDATGNLFVVDGTNLIEIIADHIQTTLANDLSGANGIAVDLSGSMYVAQTGGTVRIPNVGGVLGSRSTIAATVTSPTGVAIDKVGNLYISDSTAAKIHKVSANAILDMGSPALGAVTTRNASLFNIGNAALTITGYGDGIGFINPPIGGVSTFGVQDFFAAGAPGDGCDGSPMPTGESCDVTITFSPGTGEEGSISGQVTVESNAFSSGVILASGIAAPLTKTTTTLVIGASPNSQNVPGTVTVAPQSGSGVPTGNVLVLVDGVEKATFALNSGTVSFNLDWVKGGSRNITAIYLGDAGRVYGRSSDSKTVTVAKLTTTVSLPTDLPQGMFVLSGNSGVIPTNGSAVPYFYTFTVQVSSSAGNPGGNGGAIRFMEGTDAACGVVVTLATNDLADFGTQCLRVNPDNNVPHPVTPHTIVATYSGDDYYMPSTATPVIFQVLRNPSVVITANPTALNVSSGSTATADLTLTSLLGYGVINADPGVPYDHYTMPLQLDCTNLPARTTCTFEYPASGNSVNVTEATPGTVRLVLHTNVSIGPVAANHIPSTWSFGSLFAVGLIGLVFGRKSKLGAKVLTMICVAFVVTGMVAGMTGCSTKQLEPVPQLNTPAGSYAVTVTAKQVGQEVHIVGGRTVIWNGSENMISLPFTINVTVQ